MKASLIIGPLMVFSAVSDGKWSTALFGLALLAGGGWAAYSKSQALNQTLQPWPWPADMRAQAEALARPLDPTPHRILPPDDKAAMVAQVATTKEALDRLIADKPPSWPWTVFTSVLLQRRSAVQARLRNVVSGYQPRPGTAPLNSQAYSLIAGHALQNIIDNTVQLEQLMLSPAFTGAFGDPNDRGDSSADADAIIHVANRLMDYHEMFLTQAETCVQTPVEPELLVCVQDTAAAALQPLLSYDQFISTLCDRMGEAQDLLPYAHGGDVKLDDVTLTMKMPDGLADRILAHIKQFNS
ncbi:MAG: hypothetical protein ACOYEV_06770 [Candidatus Nanopelagicales bacterium]